MGSDRCLRHGLLQLEVESYSLAHPGHHAILALLILLLEQLLDDFCHSSVQLVEFGGQFVCLLSQMIGLHAMELSVELKLAPRLCLMKQCREAKETTQESMLRDLSSVEALTVE